MAAAGTSLLYIVVYSLKTVTFPYANNINIGFISDEAFLLISMNSRTCL
jgi:hypothetical protein